MRPKNIYTPGPWKLVCGTARNEFCDIITGKTKRDHVCDFGSWDLHGAAPGTPPSSANLALILAAPLMYELLTRVRNDISYGGRKYPVHGILGDQIDAVVSRLEKLCGPAKKTTRA
jgi:hypothetical protein